MRNSRLWVIEWLALALVIGTCAVLGFSGCRPQQPPHISRLTLLINGYTLGYLRNCGCSSAQFGGELRKAYLIRREREDQGKLKPQDQGHAAEVLLVDLGNFTDPAEEALKLESAGIVESMATLAYDSIGLGRNELVYPQNELLALLGDIGLPLTVCNLQFVAPASGEDHSAELNALLKPYLVVTKPSGFRVGIIHVIAKSVGLDQGKRAGFTLADTTPAVKGILDQHKTEADLWVLTIADSERGGINALELAQMPELALIIGYHQGKPKAAVKHEAAVDLPAFIPAPYRKAKDLLRAVLSFDQAGQPSGVVHERIPVSDRLPEDATVKAIVERVQPQLERIELDRAESQIGNKGAHPWYVGYSECAMCHQAIVQRLAQTKHQLAYTALKDKGQQRSASCVKCHVVGHGTKSGWNVLDNQPEFQGVQCENCHGPGEYHVKMQSGQEKPADLAMEGRDAFGLKPIKAEAAACVKCHDEQNSVNFNFDEYWAKIKHTTD